MIRFALVDEDQAYGVYQWHRGFSGANSAVRPRSWEDLERLVDSGSIWLASEEDDYIGLAYASYDHQGLEVEIGGLMVVELARGRGVGSTLMRLALAHILIAEKPLDVAGLRVVAHVLGSNDDPRGIIERVLRFRKTDNVTIPASELRGLRADPDGFIRGDEFELVIPDTLEALASWAEGWAGQLTAGEQAHVELTGAMTIPSWAGPLRAMAG